MGHGRRLDIRAALSLGALSPTEPSARHDRGPSPSEVGEPASEPASLDAAIVREIEAALRATPGRIEGKNGAAARLGVNPHTLRSRMRRLSVNWEQFREER